MKKWLCQILLEVLLAQRNKWDLGFSDLIFWRKNNKIFKKNGAVTLLVVTLEEEKTVPDLRRNFEDSKIYIFNNP